jgi:Uma2 family endonuclease
MDSETSDLLRFHLAPYTFSEWWDLPHEDGGRFGLVDGSLLISPSAGGTHQAAMGRLAHQLHDAIHDRGTPGLEVVTRVVVRMGENTALIPDIVVFTPPIADDYFHPPAIVCAIEVRDAATARLDATIKPTVYATGGIPHFWLVDPERERPRILCHRLVDGSYELHTTLTGGTATTVTEPFEVTLDPASMLVGP